MQLCRPYIYFGLLLAIAINICIGAFSRAEIAYDAFFPIAQLGTGVALVLFALNRWWPDHASRPIVLKPVAILLESLVLIILLIFAFRVMDHITKIFAPPCRAPLASARVILAGSPCPSFGSQTPPLTSDTFSIG